MNMFTRHRIICVLAGLLGNFFMVGFLYTTGIAASGGPEWPTQSITIIVPYNPGGGFDLVARIAAPFIEKYLPKKTSVVVKNVSGAGTRIGTRELVKAKPDGLTIAIFDPTTISLMQMGGQLEWLDSRKLSWLAKLDELPTLLVMGPKTGYKHPKELKGKKARFAAADDSAIMRGLVFSRSFGATPQFVRYGGTSEAILASMRGDLDFLTLSLASGLRQIKSSDNKMIPFMLTSRDRVPGLNVPTAQELGIDVDEYLTDHIHLLAAPPGLSPEIRHLWEETLAKVIKDPDWLGKMNKLGYAPSGYVGKEKLDSLIVTFLQRMEKYKDDMDKLSLIR